MNRFIRIAGAAVFATAAFAHAQAATLSADGSWQTFDVDSLTALSGSNEWIDINNDGKPLNFTFTVGSGNVGVLTVVDTAFAGDTFNVYNNGSLLGVTSSVPVVYYDSNPTAVSDPAAALNDLSFSRASFNLGPGSYSISGSLDQSVLLDSGGSRLNATSGGISLTVSAPVPEPETYAMLLAGLGLLGIVARRRA